MASIKIRYFKWRDGKPRWEPGPTVRKQGFKGQNLQDSAGNWLALPLAIAAAEKLNGELDDFRKGIPKKTRTRYVEDRTMRSLFTRYYGISVNDPQASDLYLRLAPKTRKDYRNKARPFLEIFGDVPVGQVTKPDLFEFYQKLKRSRGDNMASGVIAVARLALSYAELVGWIPENSNPALRLKVQKPKPRVVLWEPEEVAHIVRVGDDMGLSSVSDAIITGLHTGQRQGDVLSLPDNIFTDRVMLSQSKRGAKVDIPMTPFLKQRIAEIRERKKQAEFINLTALVIYEGNNQPYKSDLFSKKMLAVRREATKTMPSMKDKKYQDLRDTAVTRLAMAGNGTARICAITGHEQKTARSIMEHYLVMNRDLADQAMDNLDEWMAQEGIKI